MTKEQLRLYTNYIIIGVVSIFSCAFLPMIGSTVGLGWQLPTDKVGWIVWGVTKGIVGVVNMMIFYCFMEQAKVNVRNDKRYLEAKEILLKAKRHEKKPLSPSKWQAKEYSSKGTAIFISSALSTIALTQAILMFDAIQLITYAFTVTMAVVFGILQMHKAEIYWTEDFYAYALMKKGEEEENDTQN